MAHKKGLGSSRNGRDSNAQRLGFKAFGGQLVPGGTIIVRQRGTRVKPGLNVGRGKDDTLFAKVSGRIKFLDKGSMAFRREKYVPRGGPSGGDGGKGGDVIMESSERHNTLVHFRFNPEYKAQRGRHGEGSNRTGREGEEVILKVPVGTILYDDETGEKINDFSHPDDRIAIPRGGRGGRGNAR